MIRYQETLENFSKQLKFVIHNYTPHKLDLKNYKNVIISGLGGSGISGRLTKTLFSHKIGVPVEVVSDYTLPAYANKDTLVVFSSYSGFTEETLSTYEIAKQKSCKIIVLSSGGELYDDAIKSGYTTYQIEGGYQPRMALGYSMTLQYCVFSELVGEDPRAEIEKAIATLEDASKWKPELQKMMSFFAGHEARKYCVSTDAAFEAVSLRFCQQLNENTKCEAFLHAIPEANHNVIESYYGLMNSNLIFVNSNAHPRVSIRFNFLKELLEAQGNKVYVIEPADNSFAEMIRIIHIQDWYSVLSAHTLNRDEHKIDNIVKLKSFLSE